MSEIEFKQIEVVNLATMTVSFPASVEGEQVKCFISLEALQDHFNADHTDQLESFKNNRVEIESKAREIINKNRYEVDGSIFLRTADFPDEQ